MNPANFHLFKLGEIGRISIIRLDNAYSRILSKFFDRQLISNRKEIINAEKDEKNFKTDHLTYQFYFLFSFGIQDTLLSARKFYDSVLYHLEIMQILSVQNPVNLLCLESEALPTVIGVCEVIDGIVSNKIKYVQAGNSFFREIRILMIDTRQNWRRLCEYIVDEFNSYFKFINLKLDFVDNFTSLSSHRIMELDLVIVSRIFTKQWTFPQNYSSIQIILDKLKKNAVLFYFDSCNGKYYADLKHLISETHSFFQISNQVLSVQNLRNEHAYFDLIYWDNGFQPVMFSIWIKCGKVWTNLDCHTVSKDKKETKTSAKTIKRKNIFISAKKSRKNKKSLPIKLHKRRITNKTRRKIKLLDNFPHMKQCKIFKTITAGKKLSHKYPQKKPEHLYRKTFKTNTAGEKLSLSYPQKKYKYLYRKKKSNGKTVRRNKVTEQFVIMSLQIRCKCSVQKQRQNIETVDRSKAVKKLGSSNLKRKKKKKYKSPHLRTEETISNYAEFLSEIYYCKNLKKGKYFNDKLRHIPKNFTQYE